MERHEIVAWLGDEHGLTEAQLAELEEVADELAARFPGPDWAAEREAALVAAHSVLVSTDEVNLVGVAADDQAAAQAEQMAAARDFSVARAALRQTVRSTAARWGTSAEQLADMSGEPVVVIREWLR